MPLKIPKLRSGPRPATDAAGRPLPPIVLPAPRERDPDADASTCIFDLLERRQAMNARRAEGGERAARALQREVDKWGWNIEAHRLRRARLQHRPALSVGDLSTLSGVSERTILRIEADDSPGSDVVLNALAAALNRPRAAIDARWIPA